MGGSSSKMLKGLKKVHQGEQGEENLRMLTDFFLRNPADFLENFPVQFDRENIFFAVSNPTKDIESHFFKIARLKPISRTDPTKGSMVILTKCEENEENAFKAYWLPMSERSPGRCSKAYRLPQEIAKNSLMFTSMISGCNVVQGNGLVVHQFYDAQHGSASVKEDLQSSLATTSESEATPYSGLFSEDSHEDCCQAFCLGIASGGSWKLVLQEQRFTSATDMTIFLRKGGPIVFKVPAPDPFTVDLDGPPLEAADSLTRARKP